MRRNDTTTLSGMAGTVVETTVKVTKPEIDFLFMCAAQRRDFFQELSSAFSSRLFSLENELQFELLWLALEFIYQQTTEVSSVGLATILGRVLEDRGGFDDPFLRQVLVGQGGYHQILFAAPITSNDLEIARGIAKRFLVERKVETPLRRVLSQAGQNSPLHLQDILNTAARDVAQITTIGSLPIAAVAPPFGSDLPEPIAFESTGLGFMDLRLRGQIRGTVNAVLGPTGGGKTTWAVHKTVASARYAYEQAQILRAQNIQAVPELVIMVTAEESADLIKPRLQSAAFSIPRRTLEVLTDWRQLSSVETGQRDYERSLTSEQLLGPLARINNGGIPQIDVLSERERYQLHYDWFTQCCLLIDVSGSLEHPDVGGGFIPELEAIIDRITEMRQQRVREVVIDWAGALVERHIRATNKRDDAMRHLLNVFGDEVKRRIAVKHNCTVWVTHQLQAKLGQAMPGKLMHHSQAAESAAFAVHMATCCCLGTEDRRTGVRLMNFSKTRLSDGVSARPACLQIHPLFCEMIDVTDTYTIDTRSQIVSSDEAQQIGGFDLAATAQEGDDE
jgi:hypothetical protein